MNSRLIIELNREEIARNKKENIKKNAEGVEANKQKIEKNAEGVSKNRERLDLNQTLINRKT